MLFPGMLVADLSEHQRARLQEVLAGTLRERAGGDWTNRPDERGQHRRRDEMTDLASRQSSHYLSFTNSPGCERPGPHESPGSAICVRAWLR
jgi:hypothetical protein